MGAIAGTDDRRKELLANHVNRFGEKLKILAL
jgi:hypothetical protein